MNEVYATALEAHDNGLCAIPAARNGTKAPWPDGPQWAKYQTTRPDPEQLREWFDREQYPGIGLVCGAVSGGLEMLEFEGAAIAHGILDRLSVHASLVGLTDLVERVTAGYEEETPGGGLHWLYRCQHVAGNTKLARRPHPTNPNEVQVLIETRGEGGFVVVAPSSGPTHPSGKSWVRVAGDFASLASLTAEERTDLHRLCATFDQIPMPPPSTPAATTHAGGVRPGDDYNQRTDWPEVLTPHGWLLVYTHGQESAWRRPGKDRGISAITNHLGTDTLKVFSSSTPFDTETTYDRFGAYAALNFNGDLVVTGRELFRQGYGDRTALERKEQRKQTQEEDQRTRLYIGKQVVTLPSPESLVEDLLFLPGESVLYAPPKAGKTFFGLDVALSIATGRPFMYHPVMQGGVLYIAAEGVGGLGDRVAAWCQYHQVSMDDIEDAAFMATAVNLTNTAAVDALCAIVTERQPVLVTFDTLARCAVGAEENSAKDMGVVIEAVDRVRDCINGHVQLIHHAGKDVSRGMRGSSALLGAVDTVIELSGDVTNVRVRVTAQKDAPPADSWWCQIVEADRSAVITPVSAGQVAEHSQRPVLEALMTLPVEDRTDTKWRTMAESMGIAQTTYYRSKTALIATGKVTGGGKRGALYVLPEEPDEDEDNPW